MIQEYLNDTFLLFLSIYERNVYYIDQSTSTNSLPLIDKTILFES
jgi:hypothetical protein